MNKIIILMYVFFAINYLATVFINSKNIGKYIRTLSLAGICIVCLLSKSSYINSHTANANIVEIEDNSLTYGFKTIDNEYITNTVDPKKINFKGDVGDTFLVRYLYDKPRENKINTYDTVFNVEFAFIALTVFAIFLLWGHAFNKKFHSNKISILCCAGCALLIFLAVNIVINAENTYFTGDVNTTAATVVKTDIIGTEYEFTAKDNTKVTGKAVGVYGFELPVGTSVLVEYDINNKSRIKNQILASRPAAVVAWCCVPFFAFAFGIALSYIINEKNIFKEKPVQKNVPKRNMTVIAFKIAALACLADSLMRIKDNFFSGIFMLCMSAFFMLHAIVLDKLSKK